MGINIGWHDYNTSLSALEVLCWRIDKDLFSLQVAFCAGWDFRIKLKNAGYWEEEETVLAVLPVGKETNILGWEMARAKHDSVELSGSRVNMHSLPLSTVDPFEGEQMK